MKSKYNIDMQQYKTDMQQLLNLAEKMQEIGSKYEFNIFQPGAIKEIKMSILLGHKWISSKKNADACDKNDENILYEYLSGTEGGSGQIDRFFKDDKNDREQHNKHLQSVTRITRNEAFFLAYTNKDTSKPLDILRIYKVSSGEILEEAEKQLERSANKISHVGFNENFAKKHGLLVWSKQG